MPRIPYVPADPDAPAELVAAIRARRGGALLNLDRMLLHSPPLARGWNALLGAIRGELSLDPRLRELAICAVAVLTGSAYELHHHAPELVRAGGTEAQVEALRGGAAADGAAGPFDATERAVLRLARELTQGGSAADATLAAVRERVGERATVELVATVAAYGMVARFLAALGIERE